jgi:hypothetical protein
VEVTEGGMGPASPRGTLAGIKRGYPFTLTYVSFSEYGFLGWEAVLSSAPNTPLSPALVNFDPKDKPETTVTVNYAGDDTVIIRPVGGLAPIVMSISPSLGYIPVVMNQVIRIRFSKPIDPASFLFDNGLPFQGDWRTVYYPGEDGSYDNRVYKNISIESNTPILMTTIYNWATLYYPPELSADGTILTIAFRPNDFTSDLGGSRSVLTVTLNRDIRDTGGISMGRTYPFLIEMQGTTGFRSSPTDDPPYPEILNDFNYAMVKATAPSPARPDGEIWPGEHFWRIYTDDGRTHFENIILDEDGGTELPSSNPFHHFDYDSGDNWIYIAFQTELTDYAFAGALIYETYWATSSAEAYSYTGEIASPVYDPAIVGPLTDFYKKKFSAPDLSHPFDPSRPIRVVKYNLSRRTTEAAPLRVTLWFTPLDILDRPKINYLPDYSYAKTNEASLMEDDVFENGDNSVKVDNMRSPYIYVPVWYTNTAP